MSGNSLIDGEARTNQRVGNKVSNLSAKCLLNKWFLLYLWFTLCNKVQSSYHGVSAPHIYFDIAPLYQTFLYIFCSWWCYKHFLTVLLFCVIYVTYNLYNFIKQRTRVLVGVYRKKFYIKTLHGVTVPSPDTAWTPVPSNASVSVSFVINQARRKTESDFRLVLKLTGNWARWWNIRIEIDLTKPKSQTK